MSVEARYLGARIAGQLAHQQLQRAEHHRERLPRRVQAGDGQPAGEQRRRRHARRIVRLLRPRHGHGAAADLPRATSTASNASGAGDPARVHVGQLPQHHVPHAAGAVQSRIRTRPSTRSSGRRGAGAADARSAPGCRPTSSSSNPDLLGGADIVEKRRADDVQLDGAGVQAPRGERPAVPAAATCSATRRSRSSSRCASTARWCATTATEGDITHGVKVERGVPAAVRPGPAVRQQRQRRCVDRIIGGWQIAGNARVQSGRLLDLGNVRLVGMDARTICGRCSSCGSTPQGRVFMLPQDIIDETFKAFSVSATSANGYGNLGAPSGRYIAPADSLDCIETIRGEGNCGAAVGGRARGRCSSSSTSAS